MHVAHWSIFFENLAKTLTLSLASYPHLKFPTLASQQNCHIENKDFFEIRYLPITSVNENYQCPTFSTLLIKEKNQ